MIDRSLIIIGPKYEKPSDFLGLRVTSIIDLLTLLCSQTELSQIEYSRCIHPPLSLNLLGSHPGTDADEDDREGKHGFIVDKDVVRAV